MWMLNLFVMVGNIYTWFVCLTFEAPSLGDFRLGFRAPLCEFSFHLWPVVSFVLLLEHVYFLTAFYHAVRKRNCPVVSSSCVICIHGMSYVNSLWNSLFLWLLLFSISAAAFGDHVTSLLSQLGANGFWHQYFHLLAMNRWLMSLWILNALIIVVISHLIDTMHLRCISFGMNWSLLSVLYIPCSTWTIVSSWCLRDQKTRAFQLSTLICTHIMNFSLKAGLTLSVYNVPSLIIDPRNPRLRI